MNRTVMTIEFGTSKIVCSVGKKKSRGRFEVAFLLPTLYEGIKRGKWVALDNLASHLQTSIEEVKSKVKGDITDVFVGVPPCFTKVHCSFSSMDFDDERVVITPDIIDDMMARSENFYVPDDYELIACSSVFFKVDNQNLFIDPVGVEGSFIEGQFSFVYAKKSFINQVENILSLIDITVSGFKPEILCQSLFLIPVEERDASSILVDVGFNDTNVGIAYGDAIIYSRVIPVGGAHITNDLATCLTIDNKAAERLKRRFSFDGFSYSGGQMESVRLKDGELVEVDKAIIKQIVEARMDHLCKLIIKALDTSNIGLPKTAKVCLTGAGVAMMRGSIPYLKERLGRGVVLPEIETANYSTPNYYNSIGLVDYVLTYDII
jgi:cell division protein FtsA